MCKIALINELIKTHGKKKLDEVGVQVPIKEILIMFQEYGKVITENYDFYNGHISNEIMSYSFGFGIIDTICTTRNSMSISRHSEKTGVYMQDLMINIDDLKDKIDTYIYYSENGFIDVHFKNKMGLSFVTLVFSPKNK